MSPPQPGAGMEPLIEFGRILAAIRLRRRWLAVGALTGCLLALTAVSMLHSGPSASARILLARADDATTERSVSMATDVALCRSDGVVTVAATTLGITPATLRSRYLCGSETSNILVIRATGATPVAAADTTDALVDAFVDAHLARAGRFVDAQADEMLARRAKLSRSLAGIVASTTVSATPQQANSLYEVRRNLVGEIDDLTRRSQDLRAKSVSVTAGTEIVDPARPAEGGRMRTLAIAVVIGLVLGTGVSTGAAAVMGVVRDRPVRRKDVASALGTPILLDVRRRRRTLGLLGPRYEVAPAAAMVARLVKGAPAPICVLELGAPKAAVELAEATVRRLGPGVTTYVCPHLRRNRGPVGPGQSQPAVRVKDLSSALDLRARLMVESVSEHSDWAALRALSPLAVLVVKAGNLPEATLRSAVRDLAHAEIQLLGAILVDPDPDDRTDGAACDEFYQVMHRHLGWIHALGSAPDPATELRTGAG